MSNPDSRHPAPDFRLIAIVDPRDLGARDYRDALRAAQAGGATAIQVRMKHASAGALLRATEEALSVLDIPVYVNDRADVALAAGAHGVHLGADDLPPDDVGRLTVQPFRIGVSVGSPAEAAAVRPAPVRYWSLGPAYATGSKSDAGAPLEVEGFAALARLAPPGMPVIAIGGVTAENAGPLMAAGASGVAVIRAVFGAPDIAQAASRLRKVLDEGFSTGG